MLQKPKKPNSALHSVVHISSATMHVGWKPGPGVLAVWLSIYGPNVNTGARLLLYPQTRHYVDFFDRKVRTQVGLINFLKRVSKLS
jgi:hypothetical protein